MHYFKIAVVALMGLVSTVVATSLGNIGHNVNIKGRNTAEGSLKARQDYGAWLAQEYSISARDVQGEATVTVTVTTIPDYCTQSVASTSASGPAVASPGTSASANPAPVTSSPISPASANSTAGATAVPAPTTSSSIASAPAAGSNSTVTTSSLSSSVSSKTSTISSGLSSSIPTTSTTAAPTGSAADGKNFNAVFLAVLIALAGNVAFVM